ncbi:MAG: D-aminoacyl-tRNA deacylase [Nitrososphaerota archaeon]
MIKAKAAILTSTKDTASMLVRNILIESFGFKESDWCFNGSPVFMKNDIVLLTLDVPLIHAEGMDEMLDVSLIVAASRHVSEKGIKALLTHPAGNWGPDTSQGGRAFKVSKTSCAALTTSLVTLHDESSSLRGWSVGLEVTHHGPFSTKPLIFVEFGGPENELNNVNAAEVVAAATVAAIEKPKLLEPAVGFGGGHYAPLFTKLVLSGEYSFGHMIPKYAFPVTRDAVLQAFEMTVEEPSVAVIDWKGISAADRQALQSILEDFEKKIVKKK